MAVQALLTPKAGPTGYYHRELLIRTPEGRRVDLITVTDCHGILVIDADPDREKQSAVNVDRLFFHVYRQ